jgi:uncharacterized protein (DUF885 family)
VTAATHPAGVALAALAEAYWQSVLDAHPLTATQIGEPGRDERMPDESEAGIATTRARAAGLLADLEALDAEGLAADDRITHAALHEALVGDLARLDTGLVDWTVDPLEGIPVMLLTVADYQRCPTPADGDRLLARWHAMGPAVDTHASNLRRSLADGRVAARAPVERTIDLLRTLLAAPDATWPLLKPAAAIARLDGWSEGDRSRFRASLQDAVGAVIRPALERLQATLTDVILPAARGDDRPGIGHVPGGEIAYALAIRHHTSLEVTAAELHATGLAEIERIDAELVELGGRVLCTRSLAETLDRLRHDPALYFTSRDEVQAVAEASLARAAAAIPAWFGRLPRAGCEVVRMGPHEEEHSTIAYYRGPAVDGSRPGQYYLNTSAPETRPRYEAEVLAFHEAVPGHHLQIAIGQELEDLPSFRRHLGPTSYFEGWGLYTERLCDEMGLYSGDLDRLGVLSYDAWRAGRLVVDTGMHALGWSRDEAIAFMTRHSALAPNNIANEIDRYIVWPGQALAYKTGQLELLRLRALAKARLGPAFDIRGFHDAVLDHGALPLATLASVIATWIEGERQG